MSKCTISASQLTHSSEQPVKMPKTPQAVWERFKLIDDEAKIFGTALLIKD